MKGSQHQRQSDNRNLHFSLPGFSEHDQTLVVNVALRTAILFWHTPGSEIRIVAHQKFPPHGIRVLVPLLQAYPHACSYDVLQASLAPLILEKDKEHRDDPWEIKRRAIRRAIGSLQDGLKSFGLKVSSVFGSGYVLTRSQSMDLNATNGSSDVQMS